MRVWPLAVIMLAAAQLSAEVMPEPSSVNPRLQTVRWQEGQTIQLTALPATGLTILFEPGETIGKVEVDRGRIDARISSERNGLLLIPRREGELGALDVTTDRHAYRFALRTGSDLMAAYLVRFVSGPQPADLPPPMAPRPGFPPMQVAVAPMMPGMHPWTYRVDGDAAVRPASITDDGTRTTIAFAEGVALPAVFAIGPGGDEQLVNGYMRDGRFMIDEVWRELIFRIDGKKARARRNAKPDGAHG